MFGHVFLSISFFIFTICSNMVALYLAFLVIAEAGRLFEIMTSVFCLFRPDSIVSQLERPVYFIWYL